MENESTSDVRKSLKDNSTQSKRFSMQRFRETTLLAILRHQENSLPKSQRSILVKNPSVSPPSVAVDVSVLDESNLIECPLCLSLIPPSCIAKLSKCQHISCLNCLRFYLRLEITESRIEINCPQCEEPIHPNEIRDVLNDEKMFEKYGTFMVRRVLLTEPGMRWCPAPNCTFGVIAIDCMDCPKIDCERPGCNTSFCYLCKEEWHPLQTCKEAERKRLRTVDDYSNNFTKFEDEVKLCPNCQVPISKTGKDSCNHMTCSVCGWEFCWLCLEKVSDLHYLSPSGCTFWGTKPWSRRKKIFCQLGTFFGAPLGIVLLACLAIPAIIIGIPTWTARKLHRKFQYYNKHKRNTIILLGVIGSIIISPLISSFVVVISVVGLLLLIYIILPVAYLRECVQKAFGRKRNEYKPRKHVVVNSSDSSFGEDENQVKTKLDEQTLNNSATSNNSSQQTVQTDVLVHEKSYTNSPLSASKSLASISISSENFTISNSTLPSLILSSSESNSFKSAKDKLSIETLPATHVLNNEMPSKLDKTERSPPRSDEYQNEILNKISLTEINKLSLSSQCGHPTINIKSTENKTFLNLSSETSTLEGFQEDKTKETNITSITMESPSIDIHPDEVSSSKEDFSIKENLKEINKLSLSSQCGHPTINIKSTENKTFLNPSSETSTLDGFQEDKTKETNITSITMESPSIDIHPDEVSSSKEDFSIKENLKEINKLSLSSQCGHPTINFKSTENKTFLNPSSETSTLDGFQEDKTKETNITSITMESPSIDIHPDEVSSSKEDFSIKENLEIISTFDVVENTINLKSENIEDKKIKDVCINICDEK